MKENRMSQTEAIQEHLLQGGSLTPLDALYKFGCFRLSARIKNLRDAGMSIETEMITVDRKRVAKYYVK